MGLQTGFKSIGSAGKTVDGREIEPAWLTGAIESYDPQLFEAVINYCHLPKKWYGTFGKVLGLKAGKNVAGDISVMANIEPNEKLISISQDDYIYTSMEIDVNFRGTNKPYLIGLAITHDPASVGTEQLKFSNKRLTNGEIYNLEDNKNIDDIFITNFEKIKLSDLKHESEEKTILNFLKNLINRDDKKFETEEQNMSVLNQETAEALISSLSSFSEKLNKFSQNEQQPNTDDDKTKVISELEPLLKKYGLSINEAPNEEDRITELSAKVDQLVKKFSSDNSSDESGATGKDTVALESIQAGLVELTSTLKKALGEQSGTDDDEQHSGANSDLV